MEDVVPLDVGQEGIGPVLEQEVDDVVVTALRRPHRRRRDRLASLRVHIGAGVEQELAHGVLVVDSGPLEKFQTESAELVLESRVASRVHKHVTA